MFAGWIGFSQWFKEEFGNYPKRQMLVELGRMSRVEREEYTWFGPYLWEKKRLACWKIRQIMRNGGSS